VRARGVLPHRSRSLSDVGGHVSGDTELRTAEPVLAGLDHPLSR
jgi:hypothetical protein